MQQEIKRIVDENSGGLKFTKLISEMVAAKEGRVDPDVLLEMVEGMDELQVLRYSWHLSGELAREKIFIYTP